MNITLEKFCEQLLDTGKKNKLINYTGAVKQNIKLYAPEAEIIFKKISNGEKLSFFDIDTFVLRLNDELIKTNKVVDPNNDILSVESIVNSLSSKLKKDQVLSYNLEIKLKKVLKSIKKTSDVSLQETGINVLYLTFGLLNWQETTGLNFKSPLLLIPLKLEKEAIGDNYRISEYDDEIILNPTLLYKLKTEYGITLPDYQEELTLQGYLDTVFETIKKWKWTVSSEVNVGTFSFLKINMYKDIIENEETILKNENIKRILNISNGVSKELIDIKEYFKNSQEIELHNVVDADSSQIEAIVQGKTGSSFVLQGPPGTGKSQTITNLIAEFLADGKRVLFVSEKLAALNVVYTNLSKANLADFALELHSHKTNKKVVIDELNRVLELGQHELDLNSEKEIDKLKSAKKTLDEYAQIMHQKIKGLNKTPFEILDNISRYNLNNFDYEIKNISSKNEKYLDNVCNILNDVINFESEVGYDFTLNAWFGYQKNNSSKDLTKDLKEVEPYLKASITLAERVKDLLQIDLSDLNKLQYHLPFLQFLITFPYFSPNIFVQKKLKEIIVLTEKRNKLVHTININETKIFKVFKPSIFTLDLKEYKKIFDNYNSIFRIFKAQYYKDKAKIMEHCVKLKQKFSYYKINKYLLLSGEIIETKTKLIEIENRLTNLLSASFVKDTSLDFKDFENKLKDLAKIMTFDYNYFFTKNLLDFEKIKKELSQSLSEYYKTDKGIIVFDKLQSFFKKEDFDFYQTPFGKLQNRFKACLDNIDDLIVWLRFVDVLSLSKEYEIYDYILQTINDKVDRKEIINIYKGIYYKSWFDYILSTNSVLDNFSRITHDNVVDVFREKDRLSLLINRAKVIETVSKRIPAYSLNGSQVSILKKEYLKKRRQKSVRELLGIINELVQTLKPCFLMSPLSVSTYLQANNLNFDVVIFDEASQIFPWDAIVAIYRAKQIIVVGDSKQMPPSNFFNTNNFSEDDDETLDFESILDICSAIFPQKVLKWHYRSKTEDLIKFSNLNFYKDELVTFPSSFKNQKDMGIDFYYVPDGIFERGNKKNIIEAKKVVKLIFEHFDNNPQRSLGVVAFSLAQQEAIEDLLSQQRNKQPNYEKFFANDLNEPFFIKNLETVQGDERDTIIFSVGYAQDSQGKFLHNFGPLNKAGGERRLNVAITRAKYNVKLVTSIKQNDIDLNKTNAQGSKLLKEYLDWAENGHLYSETKKETISSNYLVEEIKNVLLEAGYVVETQVGSSNFKIDLVVQNLNSNNFVVAIELDGLTYRNSKITRDRDRLRKEILEKLGWVVYRMWSTDWYKNKNREKEKLLQFVSKAISTYVSKEPKIEKKQEVPFLNTKVEKELKSHFPIYFPSDVKGIIKQFPHPASALIKIIREEQPILHEVLLSKIPPIFNKEKVTSEVKDSLTYYLNKQSKIIKKEYGNEVYYVVDNKEIELRLEGRTIQTIPLIEIVAGIKKIIELNGGINKEGIFKVLTQLLEFGHIGSTILNKLEYALELLEGQGDIYQENGHYFIR
ncbi:MAG: DUF4011 domain-containing protein [Bacillales bacterium]|jgi:superfamily I DNA and/or RNA helicase|nr:DUF4011 domain-containing protein [Bacillales bacterium]